MPTLADIWRQASQNPYLDPRAMAQGETLGEGGQYGVPVLGDLLGVATDTNMYATDPESRRWPNYVMSGLGLLPGIPAPSQLRQIASEAAEMTPEALKFFGQKKVRELARQKKLAKQTAAAEAGKVVEKQKGAGKRAKVDPDVYKQLYAEQGLPAVLEAGARGEHLKPAAGGGYVGAPRTVLTGRELGGMRSGLDREIAEGAAAIEYADPQRLATWYDRAKAGQAASNEPWQLPRSLEQHAVYSAGASPEIETAFALRHHNANIFGTGETAYRGAGRETLDSAVRENRDADLAFKIGEYRAKNDPRVVEGSPFGVNDFPWRRPSATRPRRGCRGRRACRARCTRSWTWKRRWRSSAPTNAPSAARLTGPGDLARSAVGLWQGAGLVRARQRWTLPGRSRGYVDGPA